MKFLPGDIVDLLLEMGDLVYQQKLENFRRLVNAHDLFYAYSDDHRYWSAGEKSWKEINEASKEILPDDAAQIWNEMVDKRVTESSRKDYYTTAERWMELRK